MTLKYNVKHFSKLIFFVVVTSIPCLADNLDTDAKSISSILQAEKLKKEPKRPRLKFRDGPLCMCSQGMSEKEIQALEVLRSIK